MSRASANLQVNNFSGGLVTEASALNFPDGALSEALNVRILKDGSVVKRPGLRTRRSDSIGSATTGSPAPLNGYQTYRWPQQDAWVLRTGGRLIYFKYLQSGLLKIVTSTPRSSYLLLGESVSIAFSNDSIFVRHGFGIVRIPCSLNADGSVLSIGTLGPTSIQVRDFVGMPNIDHNGDEADPLDRAPGVGAIAYLTRFQQYNLFNAGWPKTIGQTISADANGGAVENRNPLAACVGSYAGETPTIIPGPVFTPAWGDSYQEFKTSTANTTAAIDTFSRWAESKTLPTTPLKGKNIVSLKSYVDDQKDFNNYVLPGGIEDYSQETAYGQYTGFLNFKYRKEPTAVAFAFNRLWQAGFQCDGVESNVAFSQVVKNVPDAYKCYQENDPTHPEINQLLATDGGLLNIEGSGTIHDMLAFKNYLLIFAENGVWSLTGEGGKYFAADSYELSKVYESGAIASGMQVVGGDKVFCVSHGGVIAISVGQLGNLEVSSVDTAIRSKINSLISNSMNSFGTTLTYDTLNSRLHILFRDYYRENDLGQQVSYTTIRRSLVFDEVLGAWSEKFFGVEGEGEVRNLSTMQITGENVQHLVGAVPDLSRFFTKNGTEDDLIYLTVTVPSSGNAQLHMCTEDDEDFEDSILAGGFTSKIATGHSTFTDPMVDKQIGHLDIFSKRTPTSDRFQEEPEAGMFRGSSCTVTPRYSWYAKDVADAEKVEAFKILQYPAQVHYDDSDVIYTRHKLRGKGRSIKLEFSNNDKYKDFHILGYSMTFSGSTSP